MGKDEGDEAFRPTSTTFQEKDERGGQSTALCASEGAVEESKGGGQEGALKPAIKS